MESPINLEKLIKARGEHSRSAVAKQLGLTRQQIWHYEKGLSEPPMSVLFKLIKFYGVELSDILDEKFYPLC